MTNMEKIKLVKLRDVVSIVFVIFIILLWSGIRVDVPFGYIFTSVPFYYIAILVILILFALTIQTRILKIITGTFSVIFGILGAIMMGFLLLGGGLFVGSEKIASINYMDSEIVAYQLNAGVTTDFTIDLVIRKRIIPGVYWQRILDSVEHGHEIDLSVENDTLTAIYDPHFSSVKKTYNLK